MMEKFMLVEKKQSVFFKILQAGLVILAVVMVFLTLLLWRPIYFTLACVCGFLALFATRRGIEFEYSYFDGELRMTRIMNKSSRKKIAIYDMDATAIIAPAGDHSLYNYEKDSRMKVRNLTSGNPDAKVYVMVTKGEKSMELVKFEPDEEFLDEICKKHAQKVKR